MNTFWKYWTSFNDWIASLNMTNFRIFVSVLLSAFFVVAVTAAIIAQRNVDPVTVGMIESFLAAMMALDVKQFSIKRNTEIVTAPQTQAQNAQATTAKPNDAS